MRILAIETSCDETAAAVVEDGTKILSNVVASSKKIQKRYGGIIPEQAAREQVKAILPVVQEALFLGLSEKELGDSARKSDLATSSKSLHPNPYTLSSISYSLNLIPSTLIPKIDAIAVTIGPGLIGSLLVGVETAKTLVYVFNKPIIPVNHLLGHTYAVWLDINDKQSNGSNHRTEIPEFPAICLIVSGGHTLLTLMQDHYRFKLLGQTRDDAAGEAFDKTARLIDLSYPGGPAIEKAALNGDPKAFPFPRPMIDSGNYDFSFSGLKTAVLREVHKIKGSGSTVAPMSTGAMANRQQTTVNGKWLMVNGLIANLAASIQEAIVDVLVDKTIRAAKEHKVKSIIVGGGVAANKRLREKFSTFNSQFAISIPPPEFCTDNAAVIAAAAFFHNKATAWKEITAVPDLQFPSNH